MQRDAYAAFVSLQWQMIQLPLHHPQRSVLAVEAEDANRYWRALASVPNNVGPITRSCARGGVASRS
jgi:hypothetical protein